MLFRDNLIEKWKSFAHRAFNSAICFRLRGKKKVCKNYHRDVWEVVTFRCQCIILHHTNRLHLLPSVCRNSIKKSCFRELTRVVGQLSFDKFIGGCEEGSGWFKWERVCVVKFKLRIEKRPQIQLFKVEKGWMSFFSIASEIFISLVHNSSRRESWEEQTAINSVRNTLNKIIHNCSIPSYPPSQPCHSIWPRSAINWL